MAHSDFLQPVLILLASAIVCVALVQKLKLSPILGYFLAGLVIGPFGLGLIADISPVAALAEIGVAFLLFDIGLHLSFKTIWESRKDFFALGPAQVLGASILIGLVAYAILRDFTAAFIIGSGLSLSSTAVAMQTLQESHEQNTPLGRSALAILIAQDIFVVFLLILMPNLNARADDLLPLLGSALLKAVAAFAFVAFLGRFLLRPVFEWITATKNSEIFTASALLFVLAMAWGVSQLGLSLPLGAFLAGLALSESDFCYLVKTEIYPFRGLLLGLFFITVGMSLNWPLALQSLETVALLVLGLFVLKAVALWAASRLMRNCQGFSIRLGLLLAQGSEFAFLLLTLAVSQRILSSDISQLLQVAVGVSLALTPALAALGRLIAQRIERGKTDVPLLLESAVGSETRIIISGFDEIGQEIAKVLEAEGIAYVAYDSDRERIARSRSKGFQVEYSDMNRPKTASTAATGGAHAVVVLWDDPEVSLFVVDAIKAMDTAIPVYAATNNFQLFEQLSIRNLDDVLIKNHETASVIAANLMRYLSFSEEKIQDRVEKMLREQRALQAVVA